MPLAFLQGMTEYAGAASHSVGSSRNPIGWLLDWLSRGGVEEYVISGAVVLAVILVLNKLLDMM